MKFLHNSAAVAVAVLAIFLSTTAPTQPAQSSLQPDNTMPVLDGPALTGKEINLPEAARGRSAAVMLSFSRAGGRDAQNWAQHLSRDYPGLAIYTVIFLESVPRLFRPVAISSIRNGMPSAMQDRTMLLYRDEKLWKQRLQVTDESHIILILLGSKGHIQWIASGPFADSPYQALSKQIRNPN